VLLAFRRERAVDVDTVGFHLGIGFAFPNYQALWTALDGKLGSHLKNQIDKAGLVVMEKIWDNGFRQITTSTKRIGCRRTYGA
jgi:TRAP-type C4-dicarboxylate transport system substrate-binding protein